MVIVYLGCVCGKHLKADTSYIFLFSVLICSEKFMFQNPLILELCANGKSTELLYTYINKDTFYL